MAAPGQIKPLEIPLPKAVDKAFDMILESPDGIALFVIGGRLRSTRRNSAVFDRMTAELKNNLVGVYDAGVDARQLREDLATFYREAA